MKNTIKKYSDFEIDLQALTDTFENFYDYLYNLQDEEQEPGYKISFLVWEQIIKSESILQLIRDFNEYRDDFISSDREVVAFIFTLERFDIL